MDDREQLIRDRAYAIWQREGRPEGRESDHWQAAAREIEQELGSPGGKPAPAGAPGTREESAADKPAAKRKTGAAGTKTAPAAKEKPAAGSAKSAAAKEKPSAAAKEKPAGKGARKKTEK